MILIYKNLDKVVTLSFGCYEVVMHDQQSCYVVITTLTREEPRFHLSLQITGSIFTPTYFSLILNSLKHLLEYQSPSCRYPPFLRWRIPGSLSQGDHRSLFWRGSTLTSDWLQLLVSTCSMNHSRKWCNPTPQGHWIEKSKKIGPEMQKKTLFSWALG